MQRSRILCFALLALALAGCQLTKPRVDLPPVLVPSNPVTLAAPQDLAVSEDPAPVSAARAVALLDAVCGASLPDFATIDTTLRENGIISSTQANPLRSAAENVSFRLTDGPGDGKTCAMTYGSTDPHETTRSAFAALGAFKETPLGLATKYRGRGAIFIYEGPGLQAGGLQYYTVRLLSER